MVQKGAYLVVLRMLMWPMARAQAAGQLCYKMRTDVMYKDAVCWDAWYEYHNT